MSTGYPSLDAVIERLGRAGYEVDHWGGAHPFRKNVYYLDRNNLQFEFVEYKSQDFTERNAYSWRQSPLADCRSGRGRHGSWSIIAA